MKATDIVDKFKKILLSETEEVKEIEVQEEVQLAEEEVIEEVKDEVSDEIPVEEVEKEDLYATKEELSKAIAEVKAMYDQLMESMSDEKSPEVPQELKSEEVSESEVELSSQESEVEPIAHSPESDVEKNNVHLYGQNRPQTIMDKVLNRIS
jgi:hypothetical protein|tara:strand:- start:4661 stop:5116 length:456 start_codon:yes stop_codon:yes gene_type:complete